MRTPSIFKRFAPTGLAARLIERRFGGFRHRYNHPDPHAPQALEAPRRVAVIGAGLAGMGAAAKLGERGFTVTLFERNAYLGGKVGAWKTTLPGGREIGLGHGFHAFFRHYYNLNEFFSRLGLDRRLRAMDDYLILTKDGRRVSFKEVATTPLINLLSLARHGVYDFWEVAGRHTGPKMEAMLRYDADETFAEWDEVSFAEFAADARLPDSLKLVFNTFSRAFFSDPDRMSMAELIKSFHFYYLSNDCGLLYDYFEDDYDKVLLAPLRDYMERHGVEIRTGCEIGGITRGEDGRFGIEGERFDYLVVASDVVGTRSIFAASPELAAAAPETAARVEGLRPSQGYSVIRLWLDRQIRETAIPGFVITERVEILDSITFVDRAERESADWVAERRAAGEGGGVIEMHCYAAPPDLPEGEAGERIMRDKFLAELHHFFPELAEAEIIHEQIYVNRDFTGFQLGAHAQRPSWDTELDTLFLAGDWVRLPFPAMLMEAAYSSGLLAANAIFRAESLAEEQVWSVPPRGFLAGLRRRPF